jgi:hypothetical protein
VVVFVPFTWLLCSSKAVDFSIGRALWWPIHFFVYTFTLFYPWLPLRASLTCSWPWMMSSKISKLPDCRMRCRQRKLRQFIENHNNKRKLYAHVRTDYIRQTLETALFRVESCVGCYTTQHFSWDLVRPDSFMFNLTLVCRFLSNCTYVNLSVATDAHLTHVRAYIHACSFVGKLLSSQHW